MLVPQETFFLSQLYKSRCSFHADFLKPPLSLPLYLFSSPLPLRHTHTQAVSAVAAEDGVRFMQEMMELSSQQQKEQLPPRAIQIVSHPFFGRVVLTAGPAQFGTDLSKSSTGVSGVCSSAKLPGFKWALSCPPVYFS